MPIEIDAEAGLWIATEGDGDRQRFAEVFQAVWQGIPAAERQQMVAYWAVGIVGQDHPPRDCSARQLRHARKQRRLWQQTYFQLRRGPFTRRSGATAESDRPRIGARFATQAPAHNAFPPNNAAKEDEADAKAEQWGYSMQALRGWTNQHVDELVDCGIHIPAGARW